MLYTEFSVTTTQTEPNIVKHARFVKTRLWVLLFSWCSYVYTRIYIKACIVLVFRFFWNSFFILQCSYLQNFSNARFSCGWEKNNKYKAKKVIKKSSSSKNNNNKRSREQVTSLNRNTRLNNNVSKWTTTSCRNQRIQCNNLKRNMIFTFTCTSYTLSVKRHILVSVFLNLFRQREIVRKMFYWEFSTDMFVKENETFQQTRFLVVFFLSQWLWSFFFVFVFFFNQEFLYHE